MHGKIGYAPRIAGVIFRRKDFEHGERRGQYSFKPGF